MTALPPLLFVPIFVGFWIGVLHLISRIVGWHGLAVAYRSTQPLPAGARTYFARSMAMRLGSYRNCVTFRAEPQAFHVSVMFPFRPGHPPLTIPWSDIEVRGTSSWWFVKRVTLSFRKAPGVTMTVARDLASSLEDASRGALRLPPPAAS